MGKINKLSDDEETNKIWDTMEQLEKEKIIIEEKLKKAYDALGERRKAFLLQHKE